MPAPGKYPDELRERAVGEAFAAARRDLRLGHGPCAFTRNENGWGLLEGEEDLRGSRATSAP